MKTRYLKRFVKKILILVITLVVLSIITIKVVENHLAKKQNESFDGAAVLARRGARPANIRPVQRGVLDLTKFYDINIPFRLPEIKGSKRDWHDWSAIKNDQHRTGLGERGMPAYITDETQKQLEHELSMDNGFNALLSDYISVNRSVPDVRRDE